MSFFSACKFDCCCSFCYSLYISLLISDRGIANVIGIRMSDITGEELLSGGETLLLISAFIYLVEVASGETTGAVSQ